MPTDTTDHRQPYRVATAMWTAARSGDRESYKALLVEALEDGLAVGVVWAALAFADVAVEHLARVTGVEAAVLVEQIALAVADGEDA
jgi:hypothetical protein